MNNCTAVIGSMTSAMKAQRVLTASAIRSEVVKLDSSVTRKGCAYGLEFDCGQLSNVRSVLSTARITATRYVNGGGSM